MSVQWLQAETIPPKVAVTIQVNFFFQINPPFLPSKPSEGCQLIHSSET